MGDGITILSNQILNNGDHFSQNMWADGITCLLCDHAVVKNNLFAENSDIDFIMGSGVGSIVANNTFSHFSATNRPTFGALMCDNFMGKRVLLCLFSITPVICFVCSTAMQGQHQVILQAC
jgi:hypothetical protein